MTGATSQLRFGLALAALICARDLFAAEPRFVAVWADGSQTSGDEVQDWLKADSKPKLSDRLLFDTDNPVRTLRDTTLSISATPASYIEFVGGDRLPGRVIAYNDGSAIPGVPPHLIVEPSVDLGIPKVTVRTQVRVLTDGIRRIVLQPVATGLPPGNALALASGATLSFRSLRWKATGVQVFTDEGIKQADFADIAAIEIGSDDPWRTYCRQLAVLTPELSSPLMRIDASGGLRMTASLERTQPRSIGRGEPQHWYHWIQPAWSLDLLAVQQRKIRYRKFLAPQELPLSCLENVGSRHRGVFSSAWSVPRVDQNVHGGALACNRETFAWGFGVHAYHELDFTLPNCATAFRTQLGIDTMASGGGCVRGRVLWNGKPLFESPLLVGETKQSDSGPLALPAANDRRLTLIADSAAAERPRGADPFDIRDLVNWLEPVVELEPAMLRRDVEQFGYAGAPLFAGWTLDALEAGSWKLMNRFDTSDRAVPCYRSLVAFDAPLTISREVAVQPGGEYAVLHFARPRAASNRAKFEVWLDGRRTNRLPIPAASESPIWQPIVVPLAPYRGRTVELTVRLDPDGKPGLVDWRGMTLADKSPSAVD